MVDIIIWFTALCCAFWLGGLGGMRLGRKQMLYLIRKDMKEKELTVCSKYFMDFVREVQIKERIKRLKAKKDVS